MSQYSVMNHLLIHIKGYGFSDKLSTYYIENFQRNYSHTLVAGYYQTVLIKGPVDLERLIKNTVVFVPNYLIHSVQRIQTIGLFFSMNGYGVFEFRELFSIIQNVIGNEKLFRFVSIREDENLVVDLVKFPDLFNGFFEVIRITKGTEELSIVLHKIVVGYMSKLYLRNISRR